MAANVTSVIAFTLLVASTAASHATEASYQCNDGTRLTAVFSPPSAASGNVVLHIVGTPGQTILPQVMSADGGRYADDRMEFWIKGWGATLTRGGRSETCHTN